MPPTHGCLAGYHINGNFPWDPPPYTYSAWWQIETDEVTGPDAAGGFHWNFRINKIRYFTSFAYGPRFDLEIFGIADSPGNPYQLNNKMFVISTDPIWGSGPIFLNRDPATFAYVAWGRDYWPPFPNLIVFTPDQCGVPTLTCGWEATSGVSGSSGEIMLTLLFGLTTGTDATSAKLFGIRNDRGGGLNPEREIVWVMGGATVSAFPWVFTLGQFDWILDPVAMPTPPVTVSMF